MNRTDHTKFAKCCEVVHCDRLADESYYSREVRNVREVFSLKTAVHFNAEAQGRKGNAEKKWIVLKKNGNDNFSNGVNLHPLGVEDKVLQKRR